MLQSEFTVECLQLEKAVTKAELFQLIADKLYNEKKAASAASILASLWERESKGSTLIEEDFALPHVESSDVFESVGIFAVLTQPIADWENPYRVRGVFFLIVKENERQKTLVEVQKLLRKLADRETIDYLLSKELSQIEKLLQTFIK